MNERIKELEKLATPRCYDETGCYIGNKFDVEKFAELIVKECLNQCYNRGMDDELYAGQLKAATYIEEYFGVEE